MVASGSPVAALAPSISTKGCAALCFRMAWLTAGVGDRIVTRRNHRRLTTAEGFVRNGALWDGKPKHASWYG